MKILKWVMVFLSLASIAGVAALAVVYMRLAPQLPDVEQLREVQYQVPLRVYTRGGELIAEFGEKRRSPLAIDAVPRRMLDAFVAAEDDRFWVHPGVDYQGLIRAGLNLIMTGRKGQGGSTITMQVARNFFLSNEKTYLRKVNEILLALKIERELSKAEILELYVNKIYLGNRAYGIGAAAEVYYGRSVLDLSLAEIAMIAGLPKAPSRYNPLADPQRALQRRNYVLGRMRELDLISPQEHAEASDAPVTALIHATRLLPDAEYVAEMVRAQMYARFGESAYTSGMRVFTTLDSTMQAAAVKAVRDNLLAYERRFGYRGPIDRLDPAEMADPAELARRLARYPGYEQLRPALVTAVDAEAISAVTVDAIEARVDWEEMKWARPRDEEGRLGPQPESPIDVLAVGDVVYLEPLADSRFALAQMPEVESAFVALDPRNGSVLALVGGFDFQRSKFNRVTQSRRQPGSNFKPFLYSAALENGFTPASLINDAPVVFDDPALEGVWRPENYSGRFFGPTRLREGLVKSRNLVSVRLLISIGVKRAMAHIDRFGFDTSQLPRDLSLALGSGSMSPLDVASGYAVFANGGHAVKPYFIDYVENRDGEIIDRADPVLSCAECAPDALLQSKVLEFAPPQVALPESPDSPEPPDSAAVTAASYRVSEPAIDPRNVYIMRSILQDVIKHGTGRRARALRRNDLAGKTGTTNDQYDAWFSGFNSRIAATAWVGYDSIRPLGDRETGSRTALPIWIDFMRVALAGVAEDSIAQPERMISMRVDRDTGESTSADNPAAMFEVFRVENAPVAPTIATGRSRVERPVAVSKPPPEQLF